MVTFSIRIDPALKEALERISARSYVSVGHVVRRYIREGLERDSAEYTVRKGPWNSGSNGKENAGGRV